MVFGEFLFIYIIYRKRRTDFRQKCYSLPRWAYSRVVLATTPTALSLITGRRRSVAVPKTIKPSPVGEGVAERDG